MLLAKYLIYLHFNSVNWNCSRVFEDSKFESQVHWRNKCGRYKSEENSVMCKYQLI